MALFQTIWMILKMKTKSKNWQKYIANTESARKTALPKPYIFCREVTVLSQRKVLVLNKSWRAIGIITLEKAMAKILALNEDGSPKVKIIDAKNNFMLFTGSLDCTKNGGITSKKADENFNKNFDLIDWGNKNVEDDKKIIKNKQKKTKKCLAIFFFYKTNKNHYNSKLFYCVIN